MRSINRNKMISRGLQLGTELGQRHPGPWPDPICRVQQSSKHTKGPISCSQQSPDMSKAVNTSIWSWFPNSGRSLTRTFSHSYDMTHAPPHHRRTSPPVATSLVRPAAVLPWIFSTAGLHPYASRHCTPPLLAAVQPRAKGQAAGSLNSPVLDSNPI